MELPDSYANLMKFVPEKARPMMEASMQMQAERANALQQQLAERQAALEEQRAIQQAQLEKAFSELPDEAKQFPAVQHDLKRQQILSDMDYEKEATMLNSYGLPSEVAQNRLKMVEEKYKRYEEDLKPIEKTEQYKIASQNWNKLGDANRRINTVIEGLGASKKLLDAGDERGALENLKTNVIKPMNAMESNDAVGVGEVLFKYSDLLSAPETAQFANKSAFSPTAYAVKLLTAKSKEEKEGVKKSLIDDITSLFEADPKSFMKTAITGANFHVDSYNKALKEQVINATSPGVARRMGANPMSYISPLDDVNQQQPTNRLATPNPFSQGMPIGSQTVSGGAGITAPTTMQQPVQNPLNVPLKGSTIFRIKQ